MDAKPKRRWLRYSLRTLLVLVTIACIGFGWLGVKVRAKQNEREVVKALRARGDYVAYDYEVAAKRVPVTSATPPGPRWLRKTLGDDYFADVVLVQYFASGAEDCPESRLSLLRAFPRLKTLDLSGTYFDDTALTHLQGLTQLEWLKLSNTGYSDAALVPLRDLPQLKELIMSNTSITDAGLIHLRGLNHLKSLKINLNRITDAGLVHLKGLTELETLILGDGVTDAGLVYLKGLTRLRELYLDGPGVTDAGLVHLQGLSELKELDIRYTQVTDKGCQELQRALPNLKIIKY